jgi:hypothetical protein
VPGARVSPKQALAFVKTHGIVLQAARGPVPSLAQAVAGEPIRGSWWGHPKGQEIFRLAEAVCDSPDVLVCKLVDGKITYVHRRLWPALVKLASRFPRAHLAKVWDEHTASGAHRARHMAFPGWVPADVARSAETLSISEAETFFAPLLAAKSKAQARGRKRACSTPTARAPRDARSRSHPPETDHG